MLLLKDLSPEIAEAVKTLADLHAAAKSLEAKLEKNKNIVKGAFSQYPVVIQFGEDAEDILRISQYSTVKFDQDAANEALKDREDLFTAVADQLKVEAAYDADDLEIETLRKCYAVSRITKLEVCPKKVKDAKFEPKTKTKAQETLMGTAA